MIHKEKTIKSNTIYKGKILNLRVDTVELPNKKYSKREIIEHSGAVAVVAITDNDEVILVRQFRKAIENDLLEIPAGKLELNEDPIECAKRELKEETGYTAKEIKLIAKTYTSPGFCNEKIYIFLANNLEQGEPMPDEGEYLEVEKIELGKVINMIKNKEILDSKTITGVLMAYMEYK